MSSELNMNDFGKFYYSARQFLDGQDMYAPNPATEMPVGNERTHRFLNLNPPHVHLAVLTIARLPPQEALWIWMLAGLAAAAVSLTIIIRELRLTFSPLSAVWWIVGLLGFSATGTWVITGQISLLLMAPATLAWRAARRGRWAASGVWLGLLMGVKPFVLIFLPWLAFQGRWRAARAAIVAIGLSFAAGLMVFGPGAHASWLRALQAADWSWAAMNASVRGVLARSLSSTPYFAPVAQAPNAIQPLWIAISIAITAVTFKELRRSGRGDADRPFAILMLAALLVAPLGWVYYWWLLLGPAVAVLRERPSRRLWPALPGLVMPLAWVIRGQPNGWTTATLGSSYFWATLFVWIAVLRRDLSPRLPRTNTGGDARRVPAP